VDIARRVWITCGAWRAAAGWRATPEPARQIREAVICWQEQVLEIRGARDVLRGGEVYNISRARLLEILTTRARDLGVRIEHAQRN
jgi:flavin-dependent dehydrogenase